MPVYVKTSDELFGAWPRAKTQTGWKSPAKVFVKKDGVWKQVFRNGVNVTLGNSDGSATFIHNFNLKAHLQSIGRWTGQAIQITVTILPNTYVTSPFLGALEGRNPLPAFATGTGWPIGSVVTLMNFGCILGAAGTPGRPCMLVPTADTQSLEQSFALESRATEKVSWKTIMALREQVAYYRNRVSISDGVRDADGNVVGRPADGGDAIENWTTMVLYNYGKIFGGGGGGGAFPYIAYAGYYGYNGTTKWTELSYGEQCNRLGGYGAGDLRIVSGVTQPGAISRQPRLVLADYRAATSDWPRYASSGMYFHDGTLASDRWGYNGRQTATSIYAPEGQNSVIPRGYYGHAISYYAQMRNNCTQQAVGSTTLGGVPANFSITHAINGVYADNGLWSQGDSSFMPDVAWLKNASGVEKFRISGGEGGDWGQDGRPAYVVYTDHDIEQWYTHTASPSPYVPAGPAPLPDHNTVKYKCFLDITPAQVNQQSPLTPPVGMYQRAYLNPDLTNKANQQKANGTYITMDREGPATRPWDWLELIGDMPTKGFSGIWSLLIEMNALRNIQPIDVTSMNWVYTQSQNFQVTYHDVGADNTFINEVKTMNNRFSQMLKGGKGGRAVKGAGAVLFMTPTDDGSFKGRIE